MKARKSRTFTRRTAATLLAATLAVTSVQYSAGSAKAAESYGLTPAQAFAIGNGDFSNETDMWNQFEAPWEWGAYDVAADWATTENGMVVDIQNTGVFHYDWNNFDTAVSYPEWLIALQQENVSLTAGYTYELSMGIESTIDRTVKIALESLDGSWNLWEDNISLKAGYNSISGIAVTASEDFTGTFTIQMGHNAQDAGTNYERHQLTISDIRFEAVGAREEYVLVKDSTFADTSRYTKTGNVAAENGYLAAAVTDLGTAPDSTNVAYTDISVTAGESYLFQFAGRSEKGRLMQVQLGNQVIAPSVALDTYTETYQYTFTAESTGTFPLTFMMGNTVGAATGTVYLDNIGLWSKDTDAAMNVSFFQPEISLAPVTLASVKTEVNEGSDAAFTYSCNDSAAWAAAQKHLFINRTEVDSSLLTMNGSQAIVSANAFTGSGVYKVAIRAEGFECSNQVSVTILPGNGNLLLNGSFENGLSDWIFYSLNNSSAAALTGDFGLKISTIWWDQWSWDNNPPYSYVEWQTMLNQSVNLTAGKSYTVAFTAYSTVERPILVGLKNMSGQGQYITLGTTPAVYEVTLNENWTEATELQFSMGYISANGVSVDEQNPAHDIYISDIVMTESVNTPIVYYPVIGGVESGAIYREPVTPVVHLKGADPITTLYKADETGNYNQIAYTEGDTISELGSYMLVVSSSADAAVKTTKTFTIRESSYNYEQSYFILTNRQNSLAMTAAGVVNGAAVIQSAYDEKSPNHYFTMEYVSGNYFVLRNAASDLVVSVKGNSNNNTAKLIVSEYDPSDKYQQWSLMYVSQGYYSLLNRGSGKAIDVPSASYDSGIQLQQYDSNASNAQQWDIIKIDMKTAIEGEPIPDTSTPELWQENAITYPLEKNLEPAGPMAITWYSLAEAESYIVQVDDEAPVTVPAAGEAMMHYDWYSVDVDKHTVTVTGVMADGTRVPSQTRTFFISKKGACWATLYRTENMNVSWYYNWGTRDSAGTDKNLEYIPMTWGNGADIADTVNRIASEGYTTLLGFNEPDGADQSNVTAAAALEAWKYMSASGMRLGSPCTAIPAPYTNGEWLKESTSFMYNWFYDFMDGIEADDDLYIDFIAIHDYDGSGEPEGFINMLKETHKNWPDYPIWVTEWGVAEWSEGKWASSPETVAQVEYFMKTVIEFMDSVDWVERYAWFPFNPNDAWGGASGIFNYDTGELNELGQLYAHSGLPAEYYELVYGDEPATEPEPTEPSESEPTEPSESEPTEPSESEPTEPSESEPTEPSESEPTEPSESEPTEPSESEPTEPSESEPVDPPAAGEYIENVAAGAVVTASTAVQPAANANDGNAGTRWESESSDPQWICFDLGASTNITKVTIDWETAAAKTYRIQVSDDGENWENVYTVTDGTSGASLEAVLDTPANGRYVRIYGDSRTTGYGYSIFEVGIYSAVDDSYYEGCNLALNKDAYASSGDAAQAVDGNSNSRWESDRTDTEYLTVDLGNVYRIDTVNLIWEAAYASAYTIDVSADGETWKTVYTETAGDGAEDTIALQDTAARYIRMNGVKRATGYGYSLWEMQVYGGKVQTAVPGEPETSESETEESEPVIVTPVKVTGVKAQAGDGQIILTWNDCGADRYIVRRMTTGTSSYEVLTDAATAAGWTDIRDVVTNKEYYYRVYGVFRGEDGTMKEGPASDLLTVSLGNPPKKTTGVQAEYRDGKIYLNWDDCGAEKYKITRYDDTRKTYVNLTFNAKAANGYIDEDIIEAERYCYRISGYFRDADGKLVNGELSDTIWVVATDKEPAKVMNVNAAVSGNAVTLTWDAADGARFYKISRAAGESGSSYETRGSLITDTVYTDKTAAAGTYRYKVVGYYIEPSGSWHYGPMSSTVFVSLK